MINPRMSPPGTRLALGTCLLALVCLGTLLATQSPTATLQYSRKTRQAGTAVGGADRQTTALPRLPVKAEARQPTRHSESASPAPLLDQPYSDPSAATAITEDLRLQLIAEEPVGRSVRGQPIHQIRIGNGRYVILMLASIHGNESAGTPLLNRLAEHLQHHTEALSDCTVVLLPQVNPDGVQNASRYNAQGVDLNRNFPADNRQNSRRYGMHALSEPESLAIFQVISHWLPDHIITLHEPLECVDYDGAAADLAAAMSAHCPLPVKKLGSRPGSLGSYAGLTLGIPIITLELPRAARNHHPDQLWQEYGAALLAAVSHRCRTPPRPESPAGNHRARRTAAGRSAEPTR